ncbi:hypothetical protein Ancab_039002 [Ancistrocladus abbreviatus]
MGHCSCRPTYTAVLCILLTVPHTCLGNCQSTTLKVNAAGGRKIPHLLFGVFFEEKFILLEEDDALFVESDSDVEFDDDESYTVLKEHDPKDKQQEEVIAKLGPRPDIGNPKGLKSKRSSKSGQHCSKSVGKEKAQLSQHLGHIIKKAQKPDGEQIMKGIEQPAQCIKELLIDVSNLKGVPTLYG